MSRAVISSRAPCRSSVPARTVSTPSCRPAAADRPRLSFEAEDGSEIASPLSDCSRDDLLDEAVGDSLAQVLEILVVRPCSRTAARPAFARCGLPGKKRQVANPSATATTADAPSHRARRLVTVRVTTGLGASVATEAGTARRGRRRLINAVRITSSAARTSLPALYRSAGSFCRHRAITACNGGGTEGASRAGASLRMAALNSNPVCP